MARADIVLETMADAVAGLDWSDIDWDTVDYLEEETTLEDEY